MHICCVRVESHVKMSKGWVTPPRLVFRIMQFVCTRCHRRGDLKNCRRASGLRLGVPSGWTLLDSTGVLSAAVLRVLWVTNWRYGFQEADLNFFLVWALHVQTNTLDPGLWLHFSGVEIWGEGHGTLLHIETLLYISSCHNCTSTKNYIFSFVPLTIVKLGKVQRRSTHVLAFSSSFVLRSFNCKAGNSWFWGFLGAPLRFITCWMGPAILLSHMAQKNSFAQGARYF